MCCGASHGTGLKSLFSARSVATGAQETREAHSATGWSFIGFPVTHHQKTHSSSTPICCPSLPDAQTLASTLYPYKNDMEPTEDFTKGQWKPNVTPHSSSRAQSSKHMLLRLLLRLLCSSSRFLYITQSPYFTAKLSFTS